MNPAREGSELPVPDSWGVAVPILPQTPAPGSSHKYNRGYVALGAEQWHWFANMFRRYGQQYFY